MSTPYEDRGRFLADTAAATPGIVNLFKNKNSTITDRSAPGDNASAYPTTFCYQFRPRHC